MVSIATLRSPKYWLIGLLSLYSSFALVGGLTFFPQDSLIHLSKQGLTIFLIISALCFIFFINLIEYLQKIKFSQEGLRTPKQKKLFFWQSVLLIFGIGLVYWVLCFPGNTSNDVTGISHNIYTSTYDDYHMIILPLLYKFLLSLWYSPAIISLFQILIFAWICALWMSFLYERGLSKKLIFCVFGIFYALPVNGTYAVTLWKDIPYTQTLILLSYLFLKYFINKDKQKNPVFAIYLGIMLAISLLLKHTGIFVFLLYALIFFLHTIYKKTWKTFFISLGVAVLCILSVEVGLRKVFHFQHNFGANQDSIIVMPINTAYLYNQSERLSPVIKEELIVEGSKDFWETGGLYSNGIFWTQGNQPYLEDIHLKLKSYNDFIRYYYYLWVDSPIIHFRTRLNLIDPIWNANGVVNLQSPVAWKEFAGYSHGRAFTDFIAPLDTIANVSSYIFPMWLSTIILLFLVIYFYLYDDKRKLVILAGWAANGICLFMISPSVDYRYFLIGTWIAVIGILLLITPSLESNN